MKKMIIGCCLFLSGVILICVSSAKNEILEAMQYVTVVSRGIDFPFGCALMAAGLTFMAYGYREK